MAAKLMYEGKQVTQFFSDAIAPLNTISNFSYAYISITVSDVTPAMLEVNPRFLEFLREALAKEYTTIDEDEDFIMFNSSEHLWQSLKALNFPAFYAFTAEGRVGSLKPDAFLPFVTGKTPQERGEEALKKYKFWSKKNNVGILAKMASKPAHAKKLGWVNGRDMAYGRENLEAGLEARVWHDILMLKYAWDGPDEDEEVDKDGCYYALLSTGDDYLLEFNREAARKDANPHWCGFMPRDDVLCGENAMGQYMMKVRDALKKWDPRCRFTKTIHAKQ